MVVVWWLWGGCDGLADLRKKLSRGVMGVSEKLSCPEG